MIREKSTNIWMPGAGTIDRVPEGQFKINRGRTWVAKLSTELARGGDFPPKNQSLGILWPSLNATDPMVRIPKLIMLPPFT